MGAADRLIAAFPATGKSFYAQSHPVLNRVADSDSSLYSWIVQQDGSKVRNPDWPHNYLRHIKDELSTGRTVLVSTHAEIRELLQDELPFTLVYPKESCRVEYLVRMARRDSPLPLIELVDKNWYAWIEEMREQACEVRIELGPGRYLSDALRGLT